MFIYLSQIFDFISQVKREGLQKEPHVYPTCAQKDDTNMKKDQIVDHLNQMLIFPVQSQAGGRK